jgi:hypothetical protein
MKNHLFLDFAYVVKSGKAVVLDTNIKKKCLDSVVGFGVIKGGDILETEGEDEKKEFYRVKIGVDLSSDEFSVSCDSGSRRLTSIVVLNSLGKWTDLRELNPDESQEIAYYLGDDKYSP